MPVSTVATELKYVPTSPKIVEIVRPPLRHLHALGPMRATMVGGAYMIAILMRQRSFDRIGMP